MQLLLYTCAAVILEYTRRQITREYDFATSLQIATGYGEVPYQYRFLVAWLCLKLSQLVPVIEFSSYLFVTDVIAVVATIWSCRIIFEKFGLSTRASLTSAISVTIPLAASSFFLPGIILCIILLIFRP